MLPDDDRPEPTFIEVCITGAIAVIVLVIVAMVVFWTSEPPPKWGP